MVRFCENAKSMKGRDSFLHMGPGSWVRGLCWSNEPSVSDDLCHQQLVSTRFEEVGLIVFKIGSKVKEINYV